MGSPAKCCGVARDVILGAIVMLLLIGCPATLLQGQSRTRNRPTPSKNEQLSDIFRNGLPYGLIEFDVPNRSDAPVASSPRLAVLDQNNLLQIFKINGTTLIQEFTLRPPESITWHTLQWFPSYNLAGVVLWSDAEESRSSGIIICYVSGKPRVVFRGGEFDLADLDGDGIPEVLQYPKYDTYEPKSVTVWTWNGRRYVSVKQMPIADLYSKDVVAAIRAAKKQPQAHASGKGSHAQD
jgi:hypothetical protein